MSIVAVRTQRGCALETEPGIAADDDDEGFGHSSLCWINRQDALNKTFRAKTILG